MKLALSLARRGLGKTSPNPAVGAVLVKDGKVIGRGYHRRAGLPHAEIEALKQAGRKAKGAALYVTLEPCDHWGKTPPCTEALIQAGIKQVVFGMRDPNPLVNGRGIGRLTRAGIGVKGGVMEREVQELNNGFVRVMRRKLPFVTVKAAQSLDGKIATHTGQSRWITGLAARRYVHQLRKEADAVLVGIQTVLKDDPSLNVYLVPQGNVKRQPKKIILDPHLKVPQKAKVFSIGEPGNTLIITSPAMANSVRAKRLVRATGCKIFPCRLKNGKFQLRSVFRQLAGDSLHQLLVEGGGETIASLLEQRLVNKVVWFIAPRIIGGRSAPTAVEGEGIAKLAGAIRLKRVRLRRFDGDICIEGYL